MQSHAEIVLYNEAGLPIYYTLCVELLEAAVPRQLSPGKKLYSTEPAKTAARTWQGCLVFFVMKTVPMYTARFLPALKDQYMVQYKANPTLSITLIELYCFSLFYLPSWLQ